jgi:hypothetical protein
MNPRRHFKYLACARKKFNYSRFAPKKFNSLVIHFSGVNSKIWELNRVIRKKRRPWATFLGYLAVLKTTSQFQNLPRKMAKIIRNFRFRCHTRLELTISGARSDRIHASRLPPPFVSLVNKMHYSAGSDSLGNYPIRNRQIC